jgi:hypothetical protein
MIWILSWNRLYLASLAQDNLSSVSEGMKSISLTIKKGGNADNIVSRPKKSGFNVAGFLILIVIIISTWPFLSKKASSNMYFRRAYVEIRWGLITK